MELTHIVPRPAVAYYEGMLRGALVRIKPDPPSIYWDWTIELNSRATALCSINYIEGRSNSLEQAHKDVLEARKLFPKVL